MSSCIDSVQLHLHTPKLSSARGMIQLLPQELIDHTIDLSVSHGVEHLKVLSVVSRAWRARSQFHILGKRCTLHLGHLFDIYSGISKSTGAAAPQEKITIPFSYVRRLNLDGVSIFPKWVGVHLEALQLFTNVTDLRIHSWDFELFESSLIRTAFEHVGRTVTTLEISHCVVNLTVLIFLMSLFPYVNDFRYEARPIHSYGGQPREFKIQDSESLSSSVKSPGKLAFLDAQKNCFLAFVSEECLDAHSITLGSEMLFTEEMQELFCRPKASELTLVCIGTFVKDNIVSLSSCTQLRTLTIRLPHGLGSYGKSWEVLRTITSPRLEEIKVSTPFEDPITDPIHGQEMVDNLLCEYNNSRGDCVGRFHLNLDLWYFKHYSKDEYHLYAEQLQRAWPKFLEKGTVKLPFEPWILGRHYLDM